MKNSFIKNRSDEANSTATRQLHRILAKQVLYFVSIRVPEAGGVCREV